MNCFSKAHYLFCRPFCFSEVVLNLLHLFRLVKQKSTFYIHFAFHFKVSDLSSRYGMTNILNFAAILVYRSKVRSSLKLVCMRKANVVQNFILSTESAKFHYYFVPFAGLWTRYIMTLTTLVTTLSVSSLLHYRLLHY